MKIIQNLVLGYHRQTKTSPQKTGHISYFHFLLGFAIPCFVFACSLMLWLFSNESDRGLGVLVGEVELASLEEEFEEDIEETGIEVTR